MQVSLLGRKRLELTPQQRRVELRCTLRQSPCPRLLLRRRLRQLPLPLRPLALWPPAVLRAAPYAVPQARKLRGVLSRELLRGDGGQATQVLLRLLPRAAAPQGCGGGGQADVALVLRSRVDERRKGCPAQVSGHDVGQQREQPRTVCAGELEQPRA